MLATKKIPFEGGGVSRKAIGFVNGQLLGQINPDAKLMSVFLWLVFLWKANYHDTLLLASTPVTPSQQGEERLQTQSIHVIIHQTR